MTEVAQPSPVTCPVCVTWRMLPHAVRPTTPIHPEEALNVMVVGYWLVLRGAHEEDLCERHKRVIIELDAQKFMFDEEQRALALAQSQAQTALPPPPPVPQTTNIAANILKRIDQVNGRGPAKPPVPAPRVPIMGRSIAPKGKPLTANTFPCPDGCGKELTSGEVHRCPGPPEAQNSVPAAPALKS